MSEDSLSYVSKSILNVLPDAIDLTKEIKYSSYVTRRDYIDVYPTVQPTGPVTSSNLGSATRIVVSDPARWLDRRSAVLSLDLGGLVVPANTFGNYAVLDGPCAMISRANIYVAGQMLNGGTINNLNKVAACVQINNGSVASYVSDEATLTGGNERLRSLLLNTDSPTCATLNRALADSPYNFIAGNANVNNAGQLFATDALGFCSTPVAPQIANGLVGNNFYGYSNVNSVNSATQTLCIPLSVLHPFFDDDTMIPLSICKEIVIEIFWASPVQTFKADLTAAAGTAVANNVLPATGATVPITSYTLSNLKISCDLVSCADEINDL